MLIRLIVDERTYWARPRVNGSSVSVCGPGFGGEISDAYMFCGSRPEFEILSSVCLCLFRETQLTTHTCAQAYRGLPTVIWWSLHTRARGNTQCNLPEPFFSSIIAGDLPPLPPHPHACFGTGF
jgi:hypothetical protein